MDKNYLVIRVDIDHESYIKVHCSDYGYHQMFVYFFDSMSTRVREFRTAKSVEFYPNAEYIMDPSLIPKRNAKQTEMSSDVSTAGHHKAPVSINLKSQNDMNNFVLEH